MEEDEFHSLNKGVFVIPHDEAQSEPGPSRRPLSRVYQLACAKLDQACESYEAERTAEQLDEVTEWLTRSNEPPLLRQSFPTRRLPVALMQGVSPGVAAQLSSLPAAVAVVNGRDMQDLASATRAVAVGFLGSAALEAKKGGRTPIDEVERWAAGRSVPLLVFVEQAQLIPSAVISELIYILTLHRSIPFRLLISVPAIRTFISSWSLLEPSEVDLSILSTGRARERSGAVNALLDAAQDLSATPLAVSGAVADELRSDAELTGGGSVGVLKSLKWLLLRHSMMTPLAEVDADEEHDLSEQIGKVAALASRIREDGHQDEFEDFIVDNSDDLTSSFNPAPRLSILAAMSKSAVFLPKVADRAAILSNTHHLDSSDVANGVSSGDAELQETDDNGAPSSREAPINGARSGADATPFQQLEAMFALWQSSGKSISLWDWLEGFRHALDGGDSKSSKPNGKRESSSESQEPGKRKREDDDEEAEEAVDEEEEARQHARFIRFVEESRMMGLVRARAKGPGKRGEEVAKGVLMI